MAVYRHARQGGDMMVVAAAAFATPDAVPADSPDMDSAEDAASDSPDMDSSAPDAIDAELCIA